MNNIVKSASRILDLLELLSAVSRPFGVSEVARRLGIPKSSAVGLLATLAARGYAVRHGTLYGIAPTLRQGGWVGGHLARLVRASHPIMAAAVDRTGESAFLGIMTPDWRIQYIDKVVSSQEVRYDGGLDHSRPTYCTSIGHCFLAYQPADAVAAFLGNTPLDRVARGTITNPETIIAELARVRERGFAESRDGHVDGASGVAAPIFGDEHCVVAGITLAAPSSRFAKEYEKLVDVCIWAAAEITRILAALEVFREPSEQNSAPISDTCGDSIPARAHAPGEITPHSDRHRNNQNRGDR